MLSEARTLWALGTVPFSGWNRAKKIALIVDIVGHLSVINHSCCWLQESSPLSGCPDVNGFGKFRVSACRRPPNEIQ
jgi:hypothetical protein